MENSKNHSEKKTDNGWGWIPLAIIFVPLLILARMSDLDYAFDLIISTLIITGFAFSIDKPISAYRSTRNKKHLGIIGISVMFIVSFAIRAFHIIM